MLIELLLLTTFASASTFKAERDPPVPTAGKQYRLILRTPGRKCTDWRKVTPNLPKEDMIVSNSKRDEGEKEDSCRFLWVVSPKEAPGPVTFEIEPFGGGAKESFDLAAPSGYVAPKSAETPHNPVAIQGIANENGTGPATTPVKGKLTLPGGIGVDNVTK